MKQLSSHQFEDIYKKLGINVNNLGCVMLDVEKKDIDNLLDEEELYTARDKKKFWIKGFVAGKKAHVTLLYGLLKQGKLYEPYIKKVLAEWKLGAVEVEKISYFDSAFKDEPYYCIIAKIKVTEKLLEGHQRLSFLPHINTYANYTPHMTIAYIKKNDALRNRVIRDYTESLKGKTLKITGINLGEDKT